MIWRACDRSWKFPQPTLVMGVVNVTPDSFSDGGNFQSTDQAVEHALRLAAEGADILDIGGESTRPGAESVDDSVELSRVIPVIKKLTDQTKAALSIDTQKPTVAQAAVDAGAVIINDIASIREDEAMWQLVAETGAGYVAMHMLGTPQTMQKAPRYCNVVNDVEVFFNNRVARWNDWGMAFEQVVLDPGIGFGKTVEHNLALLAALERFTKMQRPLLVGASRKSFIGHVTNTEVNDRLPGSLACACRAVQAGAGVVRVHDVKETVQALQTWEAIEKHESS